MPTPIRKPFGRPSLHHVMTRGKEFTDAAMEIDIDMVLDESVYTRRIGRTAASLSGVHLQREGDSDSKRLVSAAYDSIFDLMKPTLRTNDADSVQELFQRPGSLQTIREMSRTIDSYAFSYIAHSYQKNGDYLEMTDEGLKFQDGVVLPPKFEAVNGGCPYAQSDTTPYFERFTGRIVSTYTQANRSGMPDRWLDAIFRSTQN